MSMVRARAYGLVIEGDAQLLGALPRASGAVDVRVTVEIGRSGPLPSVWTWEQEADGRSEPVVRVARLGAGHYDLHYPGWGQAELVTAPGGIVIRSAEALPTGVAARLLLDELLPRWLTARGVLVLHGSAVTLPHSGVAVAFLGRSGAGKSTMALSWLSEGGLLMTDDAVVVEASEHGLRVRAGHPAVRLAAEGVPIDVGAFPVTDADDGLGKARFDATIASFDGVAPLARAYVLVSAPEGAAARVEPRPGALAMVDLVEHSYQLDPTDRAHLRAGFELAHRLASQGTLKTLAVPRGAEGLRQARALVLQDVRAG